MIHLWKASIFFICLLLSTIVIAGELTEADVRNLISRVDEAVNEQSVNAVAQALADDVVIIINIYAQGGQQVLKPHKRQYLKMLKDTWKAGTDYQYKRTNLAIEIDGDKAIISANVIESINIQGEIIKTYSEEETLVKLIDGKPLIQRVVGHIKM